MDSGLGSRLGGCGKGGEGVTGGRKGARLSDSELELLRHGVYGRDCKVSTMLLIFEDYIMWVPGAPSIT